MNSKLKFLSSIAGAFCILTLAGCGFLSSNEKSAGTTPVDHFNLSSEETTKITVAGLSTMINQEALLGTIKFDQLFSFGVKAPALSRMTKSEFQACAKKRTGDAPLSVTSDTISVQFDLDLIAACDETAKPDDKTSELSNKITGNLAVTCPGAAFSQWEGKTWGDVSQARLLEACSEGRQIQIASSYKVEGRKVSTVKNREDKDVTKVIAISERGSLTAKSGAPCSIKFENKIWTMESCRDVNYSRTYQGAPEGESISPNAEALEKPIVLQSEISLENVKLLKGDNFNHSGNTNFTLGGWTGSMTYTNGWAAPKWNATREAEKADGTFGTTIQ